MCWQKMAEKSGILLFPANASDQMILHAISILSPNFIELGELGGVLDPSVQNARTFFHRK
jgi:hypothetical protein